MRKRNTRYCISGGYEFLIIREDSVRQISRPTADRLVILYNQLIIQAREETIYKGTALDSPHFFKEISLRCIRLLKSSPKKFRIPLEDVEECFKIHFKRLHESLERDYPKIKKPLPKQNKRN